MLLEVGQRTLRRHSAEGFDNVAALQAGHQQPGVAVAVALPQFIALDGGQLPHPLLNPNPFVLIKPLLPPLNPEQQLRELFVQL